MGYKPALHLIDYAKGVIVMKWVSNGMLFLYRYLIQPTAELKTEGYLLSMDNVGYEGSFWVELKNVPVMVAFVGSALQIERGYSIYTGEVISIEKFFKDMRFTGGTLKSLAPLLDRVPVGKEYNVEVVVPPQISYHTLYSALHLGEVAKGRNWKKEE